MRLLIVDDERPVRALLKKFFESRGYHVTVAEDGAEAWQSVRVDPPDLIVSDVRMPNMDGYELVRSVRRTPATSHIPVILLSAFRESQMMVTGYESGADDYVGKPVDLEVLRLKIDALGRRSTAAPSAAALTQGRLIAVTSAKGGVGVSTIVANLSILLAAPGQSTVCAMDMNLEFGDLSVLFDLQPRSNLLDIAVELDSLGKDFVWDDYLERHGSGPRLLAAPGRTRDAATVTEEQVSHVLQGVRAAHDFVVADVPWAYTEQVLSVLTSADRILVVTSPEITSLRRTRELLNTLAQLEVPDERVSLVLNRILDVVGIDARRAEAFLQRPVTVTIPNGGPVFLEAVSVGRPVAMTQPREPAVGEIQKLMEAL